MGDDREQDYSGKQTQHVPERASSSVCLEGRVHKPAQGVEKLKSQVRGHDRESKMTAF